MALVYTASAIHSLLLPGSKRQVEIFDTAVERIAPMSLSHSSFEELVVFDLVVPPLGALLLRLSVPPPTRRRGLEQLSLSAWPLAWQRRSRWPPSSPRPTCALFGGQGVLRLLTVCLKILVSVLDTVLADGLDIRRAQSPGFLKAVGVD